MSIVGYHFRFDLRPNWRALVPVFDERARLLGCNPPGLDLQPRATRAVVSGVVDERLRRGRLRYDVVLYGSANEVVDLRLGETDGHVRIRFNVSHAEPGTWCSRDTLGVSSAGIFVPEQRTADNTRTLPAAFVARLDLWDTLARVAAIVAGAPVPPTAEFPGAPGWRFLGQSNDPKPVLDHAVAGLSFNITPLEVTDGPS